MRPAVVVVLAATLVTGCTASEAGTPRPEDAGAVPSSPPSLQQLEPCDLLTSDDREAIGLNEGLELSDLACDWKLETSSSGVSLDLSPESGMDTVPDRGTRVDIGTEFDAYEVRAPQGDEGACVVFLDVSEKSYVMFTATSGQDTDAACRLASDVAERVDPKLT